MWGNSVPRYTVDDSDSIAIPSPRLVVKKSQVATCGTAGRLHSAEPTALIIN